MTAQHTASPTVDPTDDVAELASTFSNLMRIFIRARQQMLAKARHNVEWSSHLLMSCVVNDGPLRASALAELVQSDPSTVSRQVAQLVKGGYVERQADPDDGRASLLVATDRGLALQHEYVQVRNHKFRRMLDEWDERDVRQFSALLRRFTADYEKSRKIWFDEDAELTRDAAPSSQKES
jgi:DNA-binding MarR family transcriptional regulator